MSGNLPYVPPWIFHHGSPISVGHVGRRFQRLRVRRNGMRIRCIRIDHVHVEKRRARLAHTIAVTDHENRIADAYLRRPTGMNVSLRVKYFF